MICVAFFPNSAKSPFYTYTYLTRILQQPHRMSYLSPWDCFYSNTIQKFDVISGVKRFTRTFYVIFKVICVLLKEESAFTFFNFRSFALIEP